MKIFKVTENKDGSATIDYQLTPFELKVIKRVLGVKRLTKKRINNFINKAIIAGAHKDGKELLEKGVK